ncbi:MAG: alpha-L-fucosidase [Christensenellaceae bacterium]|jgi:alpha-L-fucosidase|nr:alpha-L-fucosidase [Christensenellaceae bacterium]
MKEKLKKFLKKHSTAFISLLLVTVIIVAIVFIMYNNNKYNYYERVTAKYNDASESFAAGFSTVNNGYSFTGDEVDRLTSPKPQYRQQEYLENEFYALINFGMNTLNGVQSGTGQESPTDFKLTKAIDIAQWCRTIKAAGFSAVLLNVKDDDGFCLWSTATTTHAINHSTYAGGFADLVDTLSSTATGNGLKFGIHYTLYDKNAKSYGTPSYNNFVAAQLTELVKSDNYGDIFYFIFDDDYGPNIQPGFEYDYERFTNIIKNSGGQLQTVVSYKNRIEDVYRIGTSLDDISDDMWSVVDKNNPNGAKSSRIDLANASELTFLPAELYVNLRSSNYYNSYERPKSLKELKQLYFLSVGYNTNLMIGISPTPTGVISDEDVERLTDFGEEIAWTTSIQVTPTKITVKEFENYYEDPLLLAMNSENAQTLYEFPNTTHIVEFIFGTKTTLGRIDLREYLNASQHVEGFEIWVEDGTWKLIADRKSIGNRCIIMLKNAPSIYKVRLVIKQSRAAPFIRSVIFYERR